MAGPSDDFRLIAEALLGKAEFTSLEISQQSGVDLEQAMRLWQALGFPPVPPEQRVFTRADVEILQTVRSLIEQQDPEPAALMQLTRVIGQSLSRVSDAQVTATSERLVRDRGEASHAARNAARAELDDSNPLVERIRMFAPSIERFLAYVWRRHLLAAILRLSAVPAAADRTLSVGFADLVGFTALSEALDPHELAAMVDRFESTTYEQIVARGGRVVKMIGDEVMFAVDEAAMAAEIGLALVEAHAGDSALPDVRVGLAHGPMLAWEGDLFGATVNLASRLVNFARPNTALVSEEFGQLLSEQPAFALRHLRAVNLQGIGRVRMWVLRRAARSSEE